MTLRTIFILLYFLPSVSFGQENKHIPDIKLGTVWFKDKSTRLTLNAKLTLDSFIRQIQKDTTLSVQVISFNKDFCDKCGVRSWKRATTVLTYLAKHGVSNKRLTFTNRLEGELNKVDLFLTSLKPDNMPAPIIKRQKKQ